MCIRDSKKEDTIMCIICVSKSGICQPDESTIRTMFHHNPHGAGYMLSLIHI